MKLAHRLLVSGLMVLGSVAFSGCSSRLIGPSQTIEHPVFHRQPAAAELAAPTVPSVLNTAELINGAVGGVVKLGNWQVLVPAGAYSGTATITLTVNSAQVAVCDLSIDPASANAFSVPVTLQYQVSSGSELEQNDMLWWDPTAHVWRVITSGRNHQLNTLSAQLWHFSTYACGSKQGKGGW